MMTWFDSFNVPLPGQVLRDEYLTTHRKGDFLWLCQYLIYFVYYTCDKNKPYYFTVQYFLDFRPKPTTDHYLRVDVLRIVTYGNF